MTDASSKEYRKPVSSRSSIQLNFADTRDAVLSERLRKTSPVCESIGLSQHPPKNQEFTMNDDEGHDNTPTPAAETNGETHENAPVGRWHKGMPSPNKNGRPKAPKNAAEVRAWRRKRPAQ